MSENAFHQQNRLSWNAATKQHHTHKPDLIQRYKDGHNNLHEDDMTLLGDVAGKTVAHLQCNDGQDTLSIAKYLGARVTGIDISDEAIAFARKMADETGIDAAFIRRDIFDWFDTNETQFDVVYTSYGTINWLSDLAAWGRGIAKTLKPGGRFIIIDFHPLIAMFDTDWTLVNSYMGGEHISTDGVGDYVGNDYEGAFQNPHRANEFTWGIGDVVTALIEAGLVLAQLKEYPYINGWQRFPGMLNEGRKYYVPEDKPTLAMMFSIIAHKPES